MIHRIIGTVTGCSWGVTRLLEIEIFSSGGDFAGVILRVHKTPQAIIIAHPFTQLM